MNERPSGTVTFLFTDIEGSTRLWERHHQAMKSALSVHDQIVRRCVESHGGYVFSTGGDSFSVAFSDPVDAAIAALDVHRALADHGWAEIGQLRVRAAIDTGLADERDGDYFGPPLNRAARILGHARGGDTLCSHTTADLLKHDLPVGQSVVKVGRRRLKGVEDPETLFRITHSGDAAQRPRPMTALVVVVGLAAIGLGWWTTRGAGGGGSDEVTPTSDVATTTTSAVSARWTTVVGTVEVPPVAVGSVVVVAVEKPERALIALDTTTGLEAWRRTDLGTVRQLGTDGAFAYVTSDTRLDVVNPVDGSQVPRCGFSLPVALSRTAVESDAVYILSTGVVYRVENHPGSERCHGPRIENARFLDGFGLPSGPAVSGDLLLAGDARGLYLFDATDVSGLWKPPSDDPVVKLRPGGIALAAIEIETRDELRSQPVIAAVDEDGVLALFHPTSEPPRLDLPLMVVDEGSNPVITEDAVIVQRSNGELDALDPLTGEMLWQTMATSPAVTTDGDLVFVASDGSVIAHRTRTGEARWSVDGLPAISQLTVTPSVMLVTTPSDGSISLVERPDGLPVEAHSPVPILAAASDPEAVVREFFGAWTKGDAENMAELLGVHADFTVQLLGSFWPTAVEDQFWLWFDHDAFVGTIWTIGDCTTFPQESSSSPTVHRVECDVEVTDEVITAAGNPPTAFTVVLEIDNGVVSFFGDKGEGSHPEFRRWQDTYIPMGAWLSDNYPDDYQNRCIPEGWEIPCAELMLDKVDEWAASRES